MIVRKKPRETMRKCLFQGKGDVLIEILFREEEFSTPVRLCARIVLEPGQHIGLHQHTGEDELFYVISGRGLVDDGENPQGVVPGDSILTRSGETHSLLNPGEEDLVVLAVIPQSPAS